MGKNLEVFNHPEFGNVRVIEKDGEILFVGRDVAIALGYSNPRDALAKHVPDKYKRVSQIATPGGEQEMTVITEAGLYKLVMRSKLPNAEKFSDWTCEEVLPSIRKTGMYINPNAPIDPRFLRRIADEIEQRDKKIEALTGEVKMLEESNTVMKPKADFFDKFLHSDETMPITYIAKAYGKGGAWLNEQLKGLNIQYKLGGRWVLKYEYTGKGYTLPISTTLKNGRLVTHTEWTNKGRLLIYNKLKEVGIVPERGVDFDDLTLPLF